MSNVDLGITLIDKLVQLINSRQKNKERYFREYVEPMYYDAEAIMNDYTTLFGKLIADLKSKEDVHAITVWLEERRLQFLPLRIKVRALLRVLPGNNKASMDVFQKGIWGLMRGGMSLTEEGHTRMQDYGWGDHTVLDLLYHWYDLPLDQTRERYIRNAKEQLASLQRAWEDVVKGYADLKKTVLP